MKFTPSTKTAPAVALIAGPKRDTRVGSRVFFNMSHPLLSSIVSLDPAGEDFAVGHIITYPGIRSMRLTKAGSGVVAGLC